MRPGTALGQVTSAISQPHGEFRRRAAGVCDFFRSHDPANLNWISSVAGWHHAQTSAVCEGGEGLIEREIEAIGTLLQNDKIATAGGHKKSPC